METIENIRNLEKDIIDAMLNSNVEMLDILIHDDLLFHIPNGQSITKTMDLEGYQSGHMNISSMSVSDQQIKIFTDTAIVSSSIYMEGTYLEHEIDGMYKFIRIWKQFGNQWKVIAGSSIEAKNQ